MEYNEQTAKELQEKFGLDESTLRTWKHRNQIPDKYSDPEYKKMVVLTKAFSSAHNTLHEILKFKTMNTKAVFATANVPYQRFNDMVDVELSEADFKAVRMVVTQLKVHALKAMANRFELTKFLQRSEINIMPLMQPCTRLQYEHVIRFIDKKIELSKDEMEMLKDRLYIFSLTINIPS